MGANIRENGQETEVGEKEMKGLRYSIDLPRYVATPPLAKVEPQIDMGGITQ